MDAMKFFFSTYVALLGSWWWILLALVTFISVIVIVLKNDDYTLSTLKALRLSFVGLITLIPWVRNFVPFKLEADFMTRWMMLGLNSFWSFTLTFATISFFFAPAFFLIVLGGRLWDNFKQTEVWEDIEKYGIRNAIRSRLP